MPSSLGRQLRAALWAVRHAADRQRVTVTTPVTLTERFARAFSQRQAAKLDTNQALRLL